MMEKKGVRERERKAAAGNKQKERFEEETLCVKHGRWVNAGYSLCACGCVCVGVLPS